jgi:hypothetical protein
MVIAIVVMMVVMVVALLKNYFVVNVPTKSGVVSNFVRTGISGAARVDRAPPPEFTSIRKILKQKTKMSTKRIFNRHNRRGALCGTLEKMNEKV